MIFHFIFFTSIYIYVRKIQLSSITSENNFCLNFIYFLIQLEIDLFLLINKRIKIKNIRKINFNLN